MEELDEGDAPIVYSKLAAAGNSHSQARNGLTAQYHLDAFLVECAKKGDGTLLKGNTAYQYFCYTKSVLLKRYPDNQTLKDSDWFTAMGIQIKNQVSVYYACDLGILPNWG